MADKQTTEEELRAFHVGSKLARLDGQVVLVEYDPTWPRLLAREAKRIRFG